MVDVLFPWEKGGRSHQYWRSVFDGEASVPDCRPQQKSWKAAFRYYFLHFIAKYLYRRRQLLAASYAEGFGCSSNLSMVFSG